MGPNVRNPWYLVPDQRAQRGARICHLEVSAAGVRTIPKAIASLTSSFVVVNVDTFELEVGVTVVRSRGIDTVFIRDNFPELDKERE